MISHNKRIAAFLILLVFVVASGCGGAATTSDSAGSNVSSSPSPVSSPFPTATSTSTPIPTRVPFRARVPGSPFVHPGALNSQADLDFVKAQIAAGQNPWARAFNEMKTYAIRNKNTTTAPMTESAQKLDGRRAYANALAWYYTGDVKYAKNAIGILNVWGTTFEGYPTADGQNQLQGGWIGSLLGPAAEIMRGYSGWDPADMAKVQTMFREKFYPVLNTPSTWNGNVDLTQIDAMLSIAVFNDDEAEFNLGLQRMEARFPAYFYLKSDGGVPAIAGDGGDINKFWNNPTLWVDGLTQETCRDNGHHTQFGLASALHAAEVAWNQGVDVYGQHSDRFVAAMELMATQLLTGNMQGTCVNNFTTSDLYDTWEVGYNHYHNRMGIELPNTYTLITTRVRQAGMNDWNIFYETLTHAGEE
ncbi:MAG: alginate lyase family protein [Anaerolineae bacterium]|nr:alginate lyase family protein [Anaerolineae bacterium]